MDECMIGCVERDDDAWFAAEIERLIAKGKTHRSPLIRDRCATSPQFRVLDACNGLPHTASGRLSPLQSPAATRGKLVTPTSNASSRRSQLLEPLPRSSVSEGIVLERLYSPLKEAEANGCSPSEARLTMSQSKHKKVVRGHSATSPGIRYSHLKPKGIPRGWAGETHFQTTNGFGIGPQWTSLVSDSWYVPKMIGAFPGGRGPLQTISTNLQATGEKHRKLRCVANQNLLSDHVCFLNPRNDAVHFLNLPPHRWLRN